MKRKKKKHKKDKRALASEEQGLKVRHTFSNRLDRPPSTHKRQRLGIEMEDFI